MGGHVVYWDECCSEVKKIAALFNNFCAFIKGCCLFIYSSGGHFQSLSLLIIFSIRVSNELGYGHPRAAKYSVYIAVSESVVIGILCMVVVLLARNYIAFIFTSDKEMQEAVSNLAYLLGSTMLLNSVQQVLSGMSFFLLHITSIHSRHGCIIFFASSLS